MCVCSGCFYIYVALLYAREHVQKEAVLNDCGKKYYKPVLVQPWLILSLRKTRSRGFKDDLGEP